MHTNSFLEIKTILRAVFLSMWKIISLFFLSLSLSFLHPFCLEMSCNMGQGYWLPCDSGPQAETSEGTGCT